MGSEMCIRDRLKRPELAAKWLLRRLPAGKGFTFFYEFARPTGVTVHSLEEFCQALQKVRLKSIKFHLERGDFERWLSQVVGDEKLAEQIRWLSSQKFKGKVLRERIVSLVKARIEELKTAAKSRENSE